jgi:hypothetical protein
LLRAALAQAHAVAGALAAKYPLAAVALHFVEIAAQGIPAQLTADGQAKRAGGDAHRFTAARKQQRARPAGSRAFGDGDAFRLPGRAQASSAQNLAHLAGI